MRLRLTLTTNYSYANGSVQRKIQMPVTVVQHSIRNWTASLRKMPLAVVTVSLRLPVAVPGPV